MASRWLCCALAASLTACGTAPGIGNSVGTTPANSAGSGAPTCEKLPMSNKSKVVLGAAVGALAGAALGASTKGNKTKHAATGALGGALVGALAGSAFKNDIDVEEQPDGSVKLKIPGSVMFASGQHSLSPSFQATLNSVTATVRKYCDVTVRVVGHTDSVGSPTANMSLSERRAGSVVSYMAQQGLERNRASGEGKGQNEPIASNADEAGRQQNRRVEIFVKPPAG